MTPPGPTHDDDRPHDAARPPRLDGTGKPAASSAGRAKGGAAKLGRRIARLLWGSFAVYLMAVGFASAVPQTFFPQIESTSPTSCQTAIQRLHTQLLDQAASTARTTVDDGAFWSDWDRDYLAIRESCDDRDSYRRVGRLRYRLQTTLRRYAREEGAMSRKITRAVAAGDRLQ